GPVLGSPRWRADVTQSGMPATGANFALALCMIAAFSPVSCANTPSTPKHKTAPISIARRIVPPSISRRTKYPRTQTPVNAKHRVANSSRAAVSYTATRPEVTARKNLEAIFGRKLNGSRETPGHEAKVLHGRIVHHAKGAAIDSGTGGLI